MSIALTPFANGSLFHGSTWAVQCEATLADQIAGVALGQSRHVEKILSGANLEPAASSKSAARGAIQLLTADGEPWHRDGWMFQVMSWIAARTATPAGIIRSPHMIAADKGFDGLQLDIDASDGKVSAIVVFEDKATENPRETIRKEVWPDFKLIEQGDRENVLTAEVSALLQMHPHLDQDAAIQSIIWNQVRHYRVSITVDNTHANEAGRRGLFRGYEAIVPGALAKRRAETFVVDDLRTWMANLATLAILSVNTKVQAGV